MTFDEIKDIAGNVELTKEMRVLDLGCDTGLTSVFLAKEYGVQTFAVDLWITATDNYKRFLQMGVDDLGIPIHADATVELHCIEWWTQILEKHLDNFLIKEMDCTGTAWKKAGAYLYSYSRSMGRG